MEHEEEEEEEGEERGDEASSVILYYSHDAKCSDDRKTATTLVSVVATVVDARPLFDFTFFNNLFINLFNDKIYIIIRNAFQLLNQM